MRGDILKKTLLFISIFIFTLLLVSCSSGPSTNAPAPDDFGSIDKEEMPEVMDPSYSPDLKPDEDTIQDEDIPAGQLTSSAWSDIENFTYWKDLISYSENKQEDENHYLASEYEIFNSKAPGILEVKNMYKLSVLTPSGVPLPGAKVTVLKDDIVLFKGVTDINGAVMAFIKSIYDTDITVNVVYQNKAYSKTYKTIGNSWEVNTLIKTIDFYIDDVEPEQINALDLALVVDTTGSMKDELQYLKVELKDIVKNISQSNPNLEIRVALIFYRDEGDAYVTEKYDFNSNLEQQYINLAAQSAAGGGDTPEAVHTALDVANSLSWSENSTKIMIHVCDAPPHIEAEYIRSVAESTKNLTEKGIRVIPVICSGSDHFTELVFRVIALYTGGTYTYITDHSGIGYGHTDQAVPNNVVVEYLNAMLIRLINEYLTGKDIPPVAYNSKEKHTVSFDTQGGSKINVQLVDDNGLVTKVENPVKEGHDFVGWIIEGTSPHKEGFFSFDTPITSSITLKALWVESGDDFVLFVYYICDNERVAHTAVYGKPLMRPTVDPVKEGHTFLGWFTYEDGILTPFDFSQPITNTVDIHAIFVNNQ